MIRAFHCLGTETEDEREKQETGLTPVTYVIMFTNIHLSYQFLAVLNNKS